MNIKLKISQWIKAKYKSNLFPFMLLGTFLQIVNFDKLVTF